jgi:hypothetical protein
MPRPVPPLRAAEALAAGGAAAEMAALRRASTRRKRSVRANLETRRQGPARQKTIGSGARTADVPPQLTTRRGG